MGEVIYYTISLLEAHANLITCLILLIAGVVALSQLISMKKSRHSLLILKLYETWENEDLLKARKCANHYRFKGLDEGYNVKIKVKDAMISFEKIHNDEYYILLRICYYFETIGHLVNVGYIKLKDIDNLMERVVIENYDIFEDFIKEKRKKDERFCENFKILRDKLEKKRRYRNLLSFKKEDGGESSDNNK